MNVLPTALPGVLILEPRVVHDDRGHFLEAWQQHAFDEAVGCAVAFVQDNQSHSRRGVLRGLHFQRGASAQGKLVRVLSGAVFDVAVDIRPASATFGRWAGAELSAGNLRQMWIPPGHAHGFLVLGDAADVLYKVTAGYAPADEGALRWDDPDVGIAWPDVGGPPSVSPKDAAAPGLRDLLPGGPAR